MNDYQKTINKSQLDPDSIVGDKVNLWTADGELFAQTESACAKVLLRNKQYYLETTEDMIQFRVGTMVTVLDKSVRVDTFFV